MNGRGVLEETVIELILSMLGIPSLNRLKGLVKNYNGKVDITLVYKDKKPDNIIKILMGFGNIVNFREEKSLPRGIKELYPATIIYGLFNGRIRIYGDMPGLLSYVFAEILGLASGIVKPEINGETIKDFKGGSRGNIDIMIFVVPGIPCVKACHMLSHLASVIEDIYIEIIDVNTHEEYFKKFSNGSLPLIVINNKVRKTGSPRNYREILALLKEITRN